MADADVIIVGAGAAGLMAARELSNAGKSVIVLEARDRTGGRIMPLSREIFGYAAEGGAEFVHGATPLTHQLAKAANLTLIPPNGEFWTTLDGKLQQNFVPIPHMDLVRERLLELTEDISIAEFLDQHFHDEEYTNLRRSITRMVEGYDAADPARASTFALRDEWMGEGMGEQKKIKEGYWPLITFLETECIQKNVQILLNEKVQRVELRENVVSVSTMKKEYVGSHAIITIPPSVFDTIEFVPAQPQILESANKIGFGGVIKILLKFKTLWWKNVNGVDLSKMLMLFSSEAIPTWWTRYPDIYPVLTGWIAGPRTNAYANTPESEILDLAIASLSRTLGVSKDLIENELEVSRIINWVADPYARGAYSYVTPETPKAVQELLSPIDNKLFFAGEALYTGRESATVEAALASGKEAAEKILHA